MIWDPVEGFLVDGTGRRLGYSQATRPLAEIPGSQWFGELDGFGFISGNVNVPLQLQLTGLGQDHYVMVSADHRAAPIGGIISTGFLANGQNVFLPIELTFSNYLPLVTR